MNVLSLFSGIGGLDLGLERAGMTVVGQVEIDPWCRQILAKHWPEVPRHDDVRTAAGWWLGESRPVVDLVCGGVPCQPVSVAGKGLAQADERWLWPATVDLVGVLRPRYALLENVTGLLARGLGDVLGQLAEVGYDAEWDCVPASAVGANHQRDRVWIVGYPQCGGRMDSVRSIGEHDAARRPEWPAAVTTRFAGEAGCEPRVLAHSAADTRGQRLGSRTRIFRRLGTTQRGWWSTEPDVGRVAHGIPRRVDRLRGLGNAVVPQVAEHIGRLIMNAEAAS